MRKLSVPIVGLLVGVALSVGPGRAADATCAGKVDLWVSFSAPVASSVKGQYTVEMTWGAHTLPGGYAETTFVGYPRWTVTVGQGASIIAAPEAYPAPFTAHQAVMKFPNSVRPTEYRVAHFTLRRDAGGSGSKVTVRAFMDIWATSYCATEVRPGDNTAYASLPALVSSQPATPRPKPSPAVSTVKPSAKPTPPKPSPSPTTPVAPSARPSPSPSLTRSALAAPAVQTVASTSNGTGPAVLVLGVGLLAALLAGGSWVFARRRR